MLQWPWIRHYKLIFFIIPGISKSIESIDSISRKNLQLITIFKAILQPLIFDIFLNSLFDINSWDLFKNLKIWFIYIFNNEVLKGSGLENYTSNNTTQYNDTTE